MNGVLFIQHTYVTRFVASSWKATDLAKDAIGNVEFPTANDVQKGDLTAAMDIFSTG